MYKIRNVSLEKMTNRSSHLLDPKNFFCNLSQDEACTFSLNRFCLKLILKVGAADVSFVTSDLLATWREICTDSYDTSSLLRAGLEIILDVKDGRWK